MNTAWAKEKIIRLDQEFLLLIQRHRIKAITLFLHLLTLTATGRAWWIFAITINALHYLGHQVVIQQELVLKALFCPFVAWILGVQAKRYFARVRPSLCMPSLMPSILPPTCGSFPSSHASGTTSFYFGLLYFAHPYAHYVGVWAALVCFSRIYLGVHFLTDIIGGIALGALSTLLVVIVSSQFLG